MASPGSPREAKKTQQSILLASCVALGAGRASRERTFPRTAAAALWHNRMHSEWCFRGPVIGGGPRNIAYIAPQWEADVKCKPGPQPGRTQPFLKGTGEWGPQLEGFAPNPESRNLNLNPETPNPETQKP